MSDSSNWEALSKFKEAKIYLSDPPKNISLKDFDLTTCNFPFKEVYF